MQIFSARLAMNYLHRDIGLHTSPDMVNRSGYLYRSANTNTNQILCAHSHPNFTGQAELVRQLISTINKLGISGVQKHSVCY